MLKVNYDSAMARPTWAQVEPLARQRHHYLLASRAIGEQGIAAFLLGDITTAKKNVVKAWTVAKVADPAAHIRYASVYGTGLVELQKYGEALGPLDEAIKVSKDKPDVAYPTIAINAKIGRSAPSGFSISPHNVRCDMLAICDLILARRPAETIPAPAAAAGSTSSAVYRKQP
jgi:hypothetical protein